jgi:cytochrome c553
MGKLVKALLHALLVATFAGVACVNLSLAQTSQDEAAREAIRSMARSVCATCHGIEGRSTDAAVPNIAGQQRAYLEIQLKAFRAQNRRDPEAHDYMWGIASTWLHDDKVVAETANYFSSQAPAHGKSEDPATVAVGKQLYEKGSTDRSIRACSECHGPNAEGAFFFPRLAGQHAEYLTRQLKMLRVKLRDSPVMHGVIKDLSDNDIAAVVAYLQSK